jgi:hypothetical protein
MNELPIIQKTYDLIKWYVPILNRLPRDHKFNLGDRIISELYNFLDRLIIAQYTKEKLVISEHLILFLRPDLRLLKEVADLFP